MNKKSGHAFSSPVLSMMLLRSKPKPPKPFLTKTFLFTTTASSPQQNSITSHYFSLLHASPSLSHLKHLHAHLLKSSFYDDVILTSKLVLKYSRFDKLNSNSLSTFFHMPFRNMYSWNIIIGEFSRSNKPEMSLNLFVLMFRECKFRPDDFTLPLVLKASAGFGSLQFGVLLHGLCSKLGFGQSLYVGSGLVVLYVTFGRVFEAKLLFDEMPVRDSILWTSMLSGYVQHGELMSGLRMYREMVNFGVKLDGVVMISLVSICGQLGWLRHGRSVHGWCVRNCLDMELNLGNDIVDMYVKCAKLSFAHAVFDMMVEKDVFSWSTLILGNGLSGNVSVALSLFDRMRTAGVMPNDVTFLGVLSACAHGGLVEEARLYFDMIKDYGLVAEPKHYANMVDCLGRAGLLEEAERLINEMPMEPEDVVLAAILAGCRIHNNFSVAERIAKKLIMLEPEKPSYYVLLSNIYAAAGRFDEAEKLRMVMSKKKMSKTPGSSLIESESFVPQFQQ